MRIIMDRNGMARLATPGRSLMAANQSRTCSTAMASTVRPPKAGRMSLRMIRLLVSWVRGFQRWACRSRNSLAKAVIGCPGVRGPLSFLAGSM